MISERAKAQLMNDVSRLPSSAQERDLFAKQFDVLCFRLQLALLKGGKGLDSLKERFQEIAESLATKQSIPQVKKEMESIENLLSEPWWEDITVRMAERIRKRLRALFRFVDKKKRTIVETNIEDDEELPDFDVDVMDIIEVEE